MTTVTMNLVNDTILERLNLLAQKGRLAHAYLFVGPREVGKKTTALAVAKMMNCAQPLVRLPFYCDICPHCIKINAGHHPDVHFMDKDDGQVIKIDQVRQMITQVRLRPFSAAKKVFILGHIEDLTREGENALLKTLEEPTASSLLLLTSSAVEKSLPTVISRCHQMTFAPESQKSLAQRLMQEQKVLEADATFLAYAAQGCPARARRLYEGKACVRKNQVIDEFLLSPHSEELMKKVLADKEGLKDFLDILLSWVRDALLIKARAHGTQLVHQDRCAELNHFQQRYDFDELQYLYEEVVEMVRLWTENLNIKIPLMLIKERLWAK